MLVFTFIVLLLSVLIFLVWFFYLNIYEVKFNYNFDPSDVLIDESYRIECKGVNLLGIEIGFRNLECKYKIESGSEIIKQLEIRNNNNFEFVPLHTGTVKLLLNSKYALNPSQMILQCKENDR